MIHQSNQQPVRKYDIWLADLPATPERRVQSGVRPVIVVSNDMGTLECIHERLAIRHCMQVQLGLVA